MCLEAHKEVTGHWSEDEDEIKRTDNYPCHQVLYEEEQGQEDKELLL